jgi:hypothetical protein
MFHAMATSHWEEVAHCPLWVKSERVGMSALCQKRTFPIVAENAGVFSGYRSDPALAMTRLSVPGLTR